MNDSEADEVLAALGLLVGGLLVEDVVVRVIGEVEKWSPVSSEVAPPMSASLRSCSKRESS
eukprot:11416920-Alexandrium_andersonii.AAC.1